jgi:hypothetical protein
VAADEGAGDSLMTEITSDQLTLLREAHYEGAAYLIAGPQNVVFAARVNGTPSALDYAQVNYDTVTIGSLSDIIVDMDVRISHTNDIRKAFFYGRVREAATSSILYLNETSAAITDNDYIWVLNSFPVVRRQRRKTSFDWDKPYHGLPSIESNVPSASAILTKATTAQFSFTSIPQAVGKGTTTTGVQWVFPNATYIDGDDESEEVTIEVETPYNEWCHQTLTNSNGTTNTLHFTLTAGDPNTAPFFRLCHEDVPVSSDWDNGHSATVNYWRGVDDLLDRTRITLVSEETFDGEPLGVGNVCFIGYLRNSTSSIEGDENYGQRKGVQFDLPGLMQLAGGLRFNPIAIRHSAAPAQWDQINTPTPPRNIVYALLHSTVLNLCAFDLNGIGETFLTGNVNVEETSLMDAVRKSAREISGVLVQRADGQISLIRDPRVGSTAYRASLPSKTPTPIDPGDGYSFKFPRTAEEKVGWIEVGFAVINPSTNTPTFLTANAPASGPGDGPEDLTEPSQLLAATSNLNDALAEARQRTGDLLARANTQDTIEVNFGSGWGGVIEATPGEYYQFLVDPSEDERGLGISADDDWLCLSVNTTINRSGTQDTTGTFTKVTQGGTVLIKVAISPSVIETPIPILPVISPYPAIAMPASINYDSTSPTRRIPRDPFSGMQTLPLTTEEAAEAAQNQSNPGESRAYTYFSYNANVEMDFTTVLDEEYTLRISGSGQIGVNGGAEITFDFTASDHGFTPITVNQGIYHEGQGWGRGIDTGRIGIQKDLNQTFVAEEVEYNEPLSASGRFVRIYEYPFPSSIIASSTAAQSVYSFSHAAADGFSMDSGHSGSLSTTLRLTSIVLTQSGDGAPIEGDAFYQWNINENGERVNIQAHSGRGLYLASSAMDTGGPVAVIPPYNENSEYTVPFTGTGNPIWFRFEDDVYTDNARLPLYLSATGPGAGS